METLIIITTTTPTTNIIIIIIFTTTTSIIIIIVIIILIIIIIITEKISTKCHLMIHKNTSIESFAQSQIMDTQHFNQQIILSLREQCKDNPGRKTTKSDTVVWA